MSIASLFQNKILISAVSSWAIAQVLKTIIYAIVNRTLNFSRLVGDGGMPSGHSATVTAMAASAALEYGLNSPLFGIGAVVAIIVMHDAMSIRLEAGKHAQALNHLYQVLMSDMENEKKMKEFLGHTPLQVFFGAVLGLAVALFIYIV